MATASVQPSEMECPVCHDNFNIPKILPCAHLLCRHCLLTWLKSHTNAHCPLCRDVIADATERAGKTCEDIADSMPTDLALQARVECAAILSKHHACGGCQTSLATSICLNCGDMMCPICTKTHKHFSATKHHDVEDLATMTPEGLAATRHLVCPLHPDEQSKLYCRAHGAAICHLCADTKHRACPEVTELEDKMQQERAVLAELAAILKAGKSKQDEVIRQLDQYLLHMDKTTQADLADIDQKCDRLHTSVEALRKRAKDVAKEAKSETKKRVEETKSCMLKRRGRITSHWRLVDRVGDRMPRECGVNDMTSTLHTRVHGLDFDVTLPADLVTKTTVTIDEASVSRIEHELSVLGQATGTTALQVASPPGGGPVLVGGFFCFVLFCFVLGVCRLGSEMTNIATVHVTDWRFHTNHGQNIVLSNNQQTAERVRGDIDAIVLSSEAMTSNTLYEVRLDATDGDTARWILMCGVSDGDPATLTLPSRAGGWTQAVVIWPDDVFKYGYLTPSTVGESLLDLRVGSRVGVLVDTAHSLHLYVDGQHQGVVATNIRRPSHAFFDVHHAYKKISILPLRTVP